MHLLVRFFVKGKQMCKKKNLAQGKSTVYIFF